MSAKKIKRELGKQNSNSKYGQERLRHAKRGILSCLFAVGGLGALSGIISWAYSSYGEGHAFIGALAGITLYIVAMGIVHGMRGFKERHKKYISCYIGVTLNTLMVIIFILLYARGLG